MMSLQAHESQQGAAVLSTKASTTQGKSLQSFLASLATGGMIFLAEIAVFLLLRSRLPEYYTFKQKLTDSFTVSDDALIEKCGLDAFLFLRYLDMLLRIFVPMSFIIVPTLGPLNFHSGGGVDGATGLDRLSWANVDVNHTREHWAHCGFSLLVIWWVCRVIWYEFNTFLLIRQKRMLAEADRAFGTTVLITDIPLAYRSNKKLRGVYSGYPGGVRRVRVYRDYGRLQTKVEERDALVTELEVAEVKLIAGRVDRQRRKRPVYQRQEHRLPLFNKRWCPSIPFLGKRVDLIQHLFQKLATVNREIEEYRSEADSNVFRKQASALVEFKTVQGAHTACQSVSHPAPLVMRTRLVEVTSDHIIWSNVSFLWWERYLRVSAVSMVAATICLVCVVPVAFTGVLSQLHYLAALWPWLNWLNRVPGWFQAVLQGVLPPALLATLTIALPLILERLLIKQAVHTDTKVELLLQEYYFGFLFLQVFVVVSISSSFATVWAGRTDNAMSVATLLAKNLPKASNYFLSYIMLQGLSVSAGSLLQVGRLLGILMGRSRDRTPRQIWGRRQGFEVKWGTYFPVYTNIAVISLIYSVVSPLILILSAITFLLFRIVQRYIMLNSTRFRSDTGGMVYPKALNQLFVGIYTLELYMSGLFFLVRDAAGRPACIGQGIVMALALAATVVFQILANAAYQPLFRHLPVTWDELGGRAGQPGDTDGNTLLPVRFPRWLFHSIRRLEIADSLRGAIPAAPAGIRASDDGPGTSTDRRKDDVESETEDVTLNSPQPLIWIPKDSLGTSDREVEWARQVHGNIRISNDNATIDADGHVKCSGPPVAESDTVVSANPSVAQNHQAGCE